MHCIFSLIILIEKGPKGAFAVAHLASFLDDRVGKQQILSICQTIFDILEYTFLVWIVVVKQKFGNKNKSIAFS